ncbi:MAG TPA: outer membrane beta-barrel protein [Patescibacteria group bacterium]|nr:outer membrane beta-barrel protein [Patescibacteria group bacterium]
MKKILVIVLFLSICQFLPAGGERFFASAGFAALFPGDSHFSDIYGRVQFSPEIRAGYNLYKNFYFWLGYSFFSANGTVPILEDKSKASQNFLTLGAGWETRRGRRLQADLFAALLLAGFREKAMGETASKSGLGFEAGTGLRYFLREKVFLGISVSYSGVWTTARFAEKETDIILGGLRLSGRVGFRF